MEKYLVWSQMGYSTLRSYSVTTSGHLSDVTKASSITLDISLNATTTQFQGAGSDFTLAAGNSINGDVVIGDSTI